MPVSKGNERADRLVSTADVTALIARRKIMWEKEVADVPLFEAGNDLGLNRPEMVMIWV